MALTQPPPLHPSEFSPEVLDVLSNLLGPADKVFDPFAGRGIRLAGLCEYVGATFVGGVDIEQWTDAHASVRVGNATDPVSYPAEATTVVTSPVYFGNRISTDYLDGPTETTKLNGRRAYGISLGRALHSDNHARLCRPGQRDAHFAFAARCVVHWPKRVLLNVDLPIAEAWTGVLYDTHYAIVGVHEAHTRRYRGPANSNLRADHEVVIEARR